MTEYVVMVGLVTIAALGIYKYLDSSNVVHTRLSTQEVSGKVGTAAIHESVTTVVISDRKPEQKALGTLIGVVPLKR